MSNGHMHPSASIQNMALKAWQAFCKEGTLEAPLASERDERSHTNSRGSPITWTFISRSRIWSSFSLMSIVNFLHSVSRSRMRFRNVSVHSPLPSTRSHRGKEKKENDFQFSIEVKNKKTEGWGERDDICRIEIVRKEEIKFSVKLTEQLAVACKDHHHWLACCTSEEPHCPPITACG